MLPINQLSNREYDTDRFNRILLTLCDISMCYFLYNAILSFYLSIYYSTKIIDFTQNPCIFFITNLSLFITILIWNGVLLNRIREYIKDKPFQGLNAPDKQHIIKNPNVYNKKCNCGNLFCDCRAYGISENTSIPVPINNQFQTHSDDCDGKVIDELEIPCSCRARMGWPMSDISQLD